MNRKREQALTNMRADLEREANEQQQQKKQTTQEALVEKERDPMDEEEVHTLESVSSSGAIQERIVDNVPPESDGELGYSSPEPGTDIDDSTLVYIGKYSVYDDI